MPQVQYPFIDIAVHPAVRSKFASGDAVVLFSQDMGQVLWANGEGARLFGHANIYDLLDNGPDRSGVAFRQLAATARQLETAGDRRGLVMRISAGFSSQTIAAEVSLVEIRRGDTVVIFSAPVAANSTPAARIAAMLKGFDDPDTHMAVIDDQGALLVASPGYAALGILPETARALIAAVARSSDGLIKRPIASAAGYLPAAVGRLSTEPPLNLIFCVETVLGRMDPPQGEAEPDENISAPAATMPLAAAETVEQATSLPGVEETETLPIEGLVETAAEEDARAPSERIATDVETPVAGTTSFQEALEAVAEPIVGDAEPAEEPLQPSVEPELEPIASHPQENLELAADMAETSGEPDAPAPGAETGTDIHPDRLELADEEAEARSPAEMAAIAEPEDHVEAEMAEAALNEAETAEDIASLAMIDGASAEDVEARSIPENADLQDALAGTGPLPDAEATLEPEDHAEAAAAEDMARFAGPAATVSPQSIESELGDDSQDQSTAAAASDDQAEEHPTSVERPVETADQALDVAPEHVLPPAEEVEPADASVAEQQPEPVGEAPAAPEPAFVFKRDGRPIRFVWKLDAEGRFSEVSDEFARTVGPHAGSINGMSYRDLDSLFHLDPSREITTLLDRRDTWSGRTIRWPVEGTDLVVPVDLAALPTYSRNREFDGFRGFGIIRVADAEKDPNAIGLMLSRTELQALKADAAPAEGAEHDTTELKQDEPAAEATQHSADEQANTLSPLDAVPLTAESEFEHRYEEHGAEAPAVSFSEPETITGDDEDKGTEDKFRGEVPALRLGSQDLTDVSEKIIQLEERRSRGRDGLTQTEQNAFREIARQLEPFGKRPNETLTEEQASPPEQAAAAESADETSPEAVSPGTTADGQPQTEAVASLPIDEASPPCLALPETTIDRSLESEAEVAEAADGMIEARPPDADSGLTASAADQIPLAILIHAGDRLIHANAEFLRFSGYESLEALEAAGGLDALITRREGPEDGVNAIRADGSQVPVAARLQSVRYEGAKLLMLALTPMEPAAPAQDALAEDHEAARKLAAVKVEAEELRSILETATDGVVVLDMDGRIRSMNRSASALFNFENSEIEGKPFAMLFAHESQKAVQDYLNGLSGHGVLSVLNDGREVIGREASGGFIPLFMTMGRMPGSNSYCAVIRDITQWKRSEEELKTAKRAAETANQHKSDFLARVSHEIRTPLNAIIGFADMIASEHFGPAGHPRYVEYANDIGRSGRHVLDIVNDLLDISKIEAGEMDLEFSAVGINDCVSEAVSLVQPQANSQRVIIRTSLSQAVPDVVADLRSIKQIAINILANAIRFTPSGGQIVVSTAYEPNGSVTLRIRDTGIGMSTSELEQAMKPFGQVQPGARKRGDGTGLGLPLTKAMTEANRAMFSIQSAPNDGTLVEITFPPQRVLAD